MESLIRMINAYIDLSPQMKYQIIKDIEFMKVSWRLTTEQRPSDDRPVLTSDNLVAYFDDDIWYDYQTDIVIKKPLYWMCIPLLPNE
jgi:hypothetical protein